MKTVSLRALVNALGLFVAIVTAVSIPSGYLFVEYAAMGNSLAFQANLKANRLTKYIFQEDLWQAHTVRLADLIDVPESDDPADQQRIFDDTGKLVLEVGEAPAYPTISRAAPIIVVGVSAGRIELAASARRLVIRTSIVAALSCLLGFGMFFAVQIFPRRVLNRTLGVLEKTQNDLEAQNSKFDAALNHMFQGLCMFDAEGHLVVSNERYIQMYELSPDIVRPGCTLLDLLRHRAERGQFSGDPIVYWAELQEQLKQGKPVTQVVESANGRAISVTNSPMQNGWWVATHEDITEQRANQAKISHMVLHDALTNLPNRLFFREQMETLLSQFGRDQKFSILCLDLDSFKNVNDTLGHSFGDKLLRQVAERMRRCLRDGDTLARLSGDEFAILQTHISDVEDTSALAARLIKDVDAPFDLDGHQVAIGVSIGIAMAAESGLESDQLLKNADMALYRAKAEGKGTYRFFEPEMDRRMQARRTLELDLRRALVNNEFEVYYQPLVNLQTEEICGFEALLRWNHPTRGLVPPLDFISLAEETALIVPIGEWVVRNACEEAAKWPNEIRIAINLSPAQFKTRNLSQMVMSALAHCGLSPSRLELEITESVLLIDNASTLETLHQLRGIGVRISMDDFGTGYSSLSYLRSFPFDKIKIDGSFVHDLQKSQNSKAIVRAVTGLGASLGMATTGEGVETREEVEYLRGQGCTEAQGYFFSVARPASEVFKMLAEHNAALSAVA